MLTGGQLVFGVSLLLLWFVDLLLYFTQAPTQHCPPASPSSTSLAVLLPASYPVSLFLLLLIIYVAHAHNTAAARARLELKLLQRNATGGSVPWTTVPPLSACMRCLTHRFVALPLSLCLFLLLLFLSVTALSALPTRPLADAATAGGDVEACHRALAPALIMAMLMMAMAAATAVRCGHYVYAYFNDVSGNTSSPVRPRGAATAAAVAAAARIKAKKATGLGNANGVNANGVAATPNSTYAVVNEQKDEDEFELDEMNKDENDTNVEFDGQVHFDGGNEDDDDEDDIKIVTTNSKSSNASHTQDVDSLRMLDMGRANASGSTLRNEKFRLPLPPSDLALAAAVNSSSSNKNSSLKKSQNKSTSEASSSSSSSSASSSSKPKTIINDDENADEDDLEAWANQAMELADKVASSKQNGNGASTSTSTSDLDELFGLKS